VTKYENTGNNEEYDDYDEEDKQRKSHSSGSFSERYDMPRAQGLTEFGNKKNPIFGKLKLGSNMNQMKIKKKKKELFINHTVHQDK
jgi:hypothetical protein